MLSRFKYVLGCMVFLLAGFMNGDPSQAEIRYDWDFYELGDPAGWAAYFRQSARIRLGAEHRLPNGVSWRLLTDVNSGIAIPRLTWMPDKQRLRTANHLLDIVQGREMLVEQEGRKGIDAENEFNVKAGGYPISVKHGLTQWEVGLTYVGSRLMSLTSAAVVWSVGNKPPVLIRGLTFDLERGTIEHAKPCREKPTSDDPPGANSDPRRFQFRYGELLNLCDIANYRAFVALVKELDDKRGVRHLPPSEPNRTKGCIERPDRPVFRENREYVLYLTFAGLAVQAAGPDCAIIRTPDNPVIVPYRLLERFMLPGPWRDELLQ